MSSDRAKRRDLSGKPGNVYFHEMDSTRLGFKNESFDIVAIYNALTHLSRLCMNVFLDDPGTEEKRAPRIYSNMED